MRILRKNGFFIPLVIVLLGIGGYFFYLSQKPLEVSEVPIVPIPKAGEPPAQPKPPVGDTSQGGHWHGDEWHAEPHDTPTPAQVKTPTPPVSEPTVPPSVVEPQKTTRTPSQTGNIRIHLDDENKRLTPEQVVAYTTFINEYERDRMAFKAIGDTIDAKQDDRIREVLKWQARNLEFLKAQEAIGAEYTAGHITFDEFRARHKALEQVYPDAVQFMRTLVKDGVKAATQRSPKHIEEMGRAIKQRIAQYGELEKSLKQRKPEVERARRALEAHINAD